MIDWNKRIIDCTLNEVVEAILQKLDEKKEDQTVTSAQLCKILNCSIQQVGRYHRLGMKKHRIKKNCWKLKACKEWVATEYQAMLTRPRRK
jgi:hypothetical protein